MTDSNIGNCETDRQRPRMGKTRIKMKAVVYALSPFQQKIMPGLWKDLHGKIHHKVSENWISATLLLAPLVGVYTFQHLYVLGEKQLHQSQDPRHLEQQPRVVHSVAPSFAKPTPRPSSTVKSQSVDDSYSAFLEDMKALGALDG